MQDCNVKQKQPLFLDAIEYKNRSSSVDILFCAVLLFGMVYRISNGVDLSDEAYYAAFIDGWLKDGIGHSLNLTLHQTAAFLIYPLAWLYHAAVGSTFGLMFFLRALYAAMAFGAMLVLMRYLDRTLGRAVSMATFAYGFCFIPFSLPAPSYNTIGAFGMLAAIALFALSLLRDTEESRFGHPRAGRALTLASACCWAAAITAYPSLISVLAAMLVIAFTAFHDPHQRHHFLSYALQCAAMLALIMAGLVLAFGTAHLVEMFRFTNSTLHVSGGLSMKAVKTLALLRANPAFSALCLMALGSGVILGVFDTSRRAVIFLLVVMSAGIVYCAALPVPALFLQTHDLVTIVALFGVHLPIRALRSKGSGLKTPALMYCTSVAAGLVTAATASNGLFNFPVGGLLASCLALAFIPEPVPSTKRTRAAHVAFIGLAAVVMATWSFRFFYGEPYGNPLTTPALRLKSGPFAGLRTSTANAAIVEAIAGQLPQQPTDGRDKAGVVALGRLPAVYLLTVLSPIALTTWNFGSYPGDEANRMVQRLYEDPAHQPSYVLQYSDPWTAPLTQVEERLVSRYTLLRTVTLKECTIKLYGR